MKKKRILPGCLCVGLVNICLLAGCNGVNEAVTVPTPTPAEVINATPVPMPEPSPLIETKALTISVINLSKVDAGMFSVIDPITQEQTNIDCMNSGETISLEANWPVDTQDFQWALYNSQGELCIEASSNIAEADSKVTLVLIGIDTIETVEVRFD